MINYTPFIRNKNILITGGTGSFGYAAVTKLLNYHPKRITIFSRDEKKQFDMRNAFNDPRLRFIIGDVRKISSVDSAIEGADYVFHAAALKQVPTCEFFPVEAILTNSLGADNVIRTAIHHKVKKLVILSTDKAVYPINAMGLSKALMEKIMIAEAKTLVENKNHQTILCGVRYGNVLYTRGSVIPFFISQIKAGQPITITNPNMTRFLLPLSAAVELVLHAFTKGKNGHMYIRKAPATNIQTLAQAVAELFDYQKGIKEVGIRAGEKLHESLISVEESIRAIDEGDYYNIPPESEGLEYQKYYSVGKRIYQFVPTAFTSENTAQLNLSQTKQLLLTLPEVQQELKDFQPPTKPNGLSKRVAQKEGLPARAASSEHGGRDIL